MIERMFIQTPNTAMIKQQIREFEDKKLRAQPWYGALARLYAFATPKIKIIEGRIEYVYSKEHKKAESDIMKVINLIFTIQED